ncbi:MAG: alcohol dehydrogenase catalytic domain-containing protein [Gaiellaceae bacterium]
MRVALLPAVGAPLELVERDDPLPGPGEARVRIEACGVCGSDLFLQDGGFGADKLPVVPGHEAAGVVDRVGEGVTEVCAGDQVAIYYIENVPNAPRPNLGPAVRRMGVDVDGAFAEYVVRPVSTLIRPSRPLPPATLAVLTDAVGTAYHALVRIAEVKPAETVAVLGVGGVGSNAVQVAKALGARVVAIARSAEKRELARGLGADEAVSISDALAAIGGDGADVVVQCASSATMDEAAIKLAGYAGRVVFVATTPGSFSTCASTLVWRELALLGSRGFTVADIEAVIDLYLAGAITTEHLTAATRPLEEANEALDDLRAGRVMRSVLVPRA